MTHLRLSMTLLVRAVCRVALLAAVGLGTCTPLAKVTTQKPRWRPVAGAAAPSEEHPLEKDARLATAESTKIVPSGHGSHAHPEGIAEMQRILRLHLAGISSNHPTLSKHPTP